MKKGRVKKVENRKLREKEILNYLSEKYQEAFELLGRLGQSRGLPGDLWGAKPIGGSEEEAFTVTGNLTKDGYLLKDSYYRVYIRKAYDEFVRQIIKKAVPEFSANITIVRCYSHADGLTHRIPVSEIWRYTGEGEYFKSKITVFVPQTKLKKRKLDEAAKAICIGLAEAKLMAWVECRWRDGRKKEKAVYFVNEAYEAREKEVFPGYASNKKTNKEELVTCWQIERLCCLIYLEGLVYHKDIGTLSDILSYMLLFGYDDCRICGKLTNELTREEWDAVIRSVLADPYLSSLRIVRCVNISETMPVSGEVLPGHKAVCFMDEDGRAYIIFRGTFGDEEWLDNARGMIYADTKQQKYSLRFVHEIREDENLKVKSLTVAGHSKGGNKAQYVTITAPEGYIDRCVSIDGQGFSRAFVNKYRKNIEKRKQDLELLAEERDFVNCMGIYLNKTVYIRGRRGKHTQTEAYGQPLAFFHCPDALRNERGEEGIESADSSVSGVINLLLCRLLSDESYIKVRREILYSMISLMMTQKIAENTDIAESIKNLLLIFFDMAAESDILTNSIRLLIFREPDLLLATVLALSEKDKKIVETEGLEGIGKLVRGKLVLAFLSEPSRFHNFTVFLRKFLQIMKEFSEEAKSEPLILDYLIQFVTKLLEAMEHKYSVAGKLLVKRLLKNFLKVKEEREGI